MTSICVLSLFRPRIVTGWRSSNNSPHRKCLPPLQQPQGSAFLFWICLPECSCVLQQADFMNSHKMYHIENLKSSSTSPLYIQLSDSPLMQRRLLCIIKLVTRQPEAPIFILKILLNSGRKKLFHYLPALSWLCLISILSQSFLQLLGYV